MLVTEPGAGDTNTSAPGSILIKPLRSRGLPMALLTVWSKSNGHTECVISLISPYTNDIARTPANSMGKKVVKLSEVYAVNEALSRKKR